MKSIYIVIVLSLIKICYTFGQEKTEIDLGTFYPHNLDVLAAEDSSLCIYFKNPTTDKYKIIDKTGMLVRAVSYNNKDYEHGEKLPLLGKVITDSAFVFYFASKKGDFAMNMQSVSRHGNKDTRVENISFKTEPGDQLLYSFQNTNKYCVFTCDKSRRKLKLFVFNGSAQYKAYIYENTSLIDFYKSPETVSISGNNITSIINASKIQKIYNTDTDFLTLTWDQLQQPDNTVSTVLWQFDLNTGELKKHQFTGTIANANSFYFEGVLYRLTLIPEQLKLELFDVETEKPLFNYEYGKEQRLELVYDKVINDDIADLTNPSQILQLLSQNYPAVSVTRANGDTLCLLIGSYPNKAVKNTGIIVGTSTQTSTVTSPEGTTLKLPSEFKLGDRNNYTRFSSLIRKSDYAVIHNSSHTPDFSRYEHAASSLKKAGVSYDYSVKFRIGQGYFFGYLPKNSTGLKIIQVQ